MEYYACGKEAHYEPIPNGYRNSAHLVVDGVVLRAKNGNDYAYWSGVYDGKLAERFLEIADKMNTGTQVTGNCNLCNGLIDKCQIIVTNERWFSVQKV